MNGLRLRPPAFEPARHRLALVAAIDRAEATLLLMSF